MSISPKLKGLWRLDSLPWALQLCFEGLPSMQLNSTTLPTGFMPDSTWPGRVKLVELLSTAIACEDLTSTLHILDVCASWLDRHMALLAPQVEYFLSHAAGDMAACLQLALMEVVVKTTLLARQTIHHAVRCAMLLVPHSTVDEGHSCTSVSDADTALSKQHQSLIQRLQTMQQKHRESVMHSNTNWHLQQLEQVSNGSQWQAAVRGCLVNVHMHHALVLAAQQQDADSCQRTFAQAAHPQLPMLTHAAMLANETAATHSIIGRSVLHMLAKIFQKWQVEMPQFMSSQYIEA